MSEMLILAVSVKYKERAHREVRAACATRELSNHRQGNKRKTDRRKKTQQASEGARVVGRKRVREIEERDTE